MNKQKNKEIIIAILGVFLIVGLSLFIFVRSNYDSQMKELTQSVKEIVFGSADSIGNYAVVTTNNWGAPISYVPAILHKVIIGTANDSVRIADDTITPSTNKVFQITATTPGTFDIEGLFNTGIVANVTSTTGVIFVFSPK